DEAEGSAAEEHEAGAQTAGDELEGVQVAGAGAERQRSLRVRHRPVGQGRRLHRVDHSRGGVPAGSADAVQAVCGGVRLRPEFREPDADSRPREIGHSFTFSPTYTRCAGEYSAPLPSLKTR